MFSSWNPVNELGTNLRMAGPVSLSFESEIEPGHLAGVSYFYYVGNSIISIKEVANLTQVGCLVASCAVSFVPLSVELFWFC